VELKNILIEQQEEAHQIGQRSIPREKFPAFKKLLQSKLIKIVLGVRRSGKSTLCLQSCKKNEYAYVHH
jgi:predicted AAA+ superfamily ATPase